MSIEATYRRCPQRHLYRSQWHTLCPFCGVAVGNTGRYGAEPPAPAPAPVDGAVQPKPASQTEEPTVGFWPVEQRPVVGWLVVIQGPRQGQDLRLRPGNNALCGEEAENLQIRDPLSGGESWLIVVYDPRHGTFGVKEARHRQLVYLNGAVISGHQPLSARDVLQAGPHHLLFVPFCGPRFRWSDEMPVPSTSHHHLTLQPRNTETP